MNIFTKTYNWEDLAALDEDVYWALESSPHLEGEFSGTVKITIEYIKEQK